PLRTRMVDAFKQLTEAHNTLRDHSDHADKRGERADLLRYQIREIEELDPRPNEQRELLEERDRLRHAERLASVTGSAEDSLYSGDQAICAELARILRGLEEAVELDAQLKPIVTQLASAHRELEDASRELGAYARAIVHDDARLTEVEERLDALSRVARKYGGSIESALAHKERAKKEL